MQESTSPALHCAPCTLRRSPWHRWQTATCFPGRDSTCRCDKASFASANRALIRFSDTFCRHLETSKQDYSQQRSNLLIVYYSVLSAIADAVPIPIAGACSAHKFRVAEVAGLCPYRKPVMAFHFHGCVRAPLYNLSRCIWSVPFHIFREERVRQYSLASLLFFISTRMRLRLAIFLHR